MYGFSNILAVCILHTGSYVFWTCTRHRNYGLPSQQLVGSGTLCYICLASHHGGIAGNIDVMSKLYISWRWAYGDRFIPYDAARKLFIGVGMNIDNHIGTILKKRNQDIIMLDSTKRDNVTKTDNTIDILHKALQLWRAEERDEMNNLLRTTGHFNNPKFEQIMQAIIEAGAEQPDVHSETDERRDVAAFLGGRKFEAAGGQTGSLDDYV